MAISKSAKIEAEIESYANLNSSYWQSHFYAYGRLP